MPSQTWMEVGRQTAAWTHDTAGVRPAGGSGLSGLAAARTGAWCKAAPRSPPQAELVAMNLVILCTNGGRFVLWE